MQVVHKMDRLVLQSGAFRYPTCTGQGLNVGNYIYVSLGAVSDLQWIAVTDERNFEILITGGDKTHETLPRQRYLLLGIHDYNRPLYNITARIMHLKGNRFHLAPYVTKPALIRKSLVQETKPLLSRPNKGIYC